MITPHTEPQGDQDKIIIPEGFEVGTALTGTNTGPLITHGFSEPMDFDHLEPGDVGALVDIADAIETAEIEVIKLYGESIEEHSHRSPKPTTQVFVNLGHENPEAFREETRSDFAELKTDPVALARASAVATAAIRLSSSKSAAEIVTLPLDGVASHDGQLSAE
jgi:hypothetical protein